MNCRSTRKKYSEWEIPEEEQKKLALSGTGTEKLVTRPIRCPRCHQVQFKAFSDCTGHLEVLCDRCKLPFVMSFSYFHRSEDYVQPWNARYLKKG